MQNDAISMFKQAALSLQKEEAYLNYVKAKKENDTDETLQQLIGDFNIARISLNEELTKSSDKKDEEKIRELNKHVSDLYANIMTSESMNAYNTAKKELDDMINYIYAIVNTATNGDDPNSVTGAPQEGCAGSCSSCSGCG